MQEVTSMSDLLKNGAGARWEELSREVQSMNRALNGFTLLGVLDAETSHIAAMQEEIDHKTREALVAYWLGNRGHGLPYNIN